MKLEKNLQFIKELKNKIKDNELDFDNEEYYDDSLNCSVSDDEIMNELKRKFDELFGPIDPED